VTFNRAGLKKIKIHQKFANNLKKYIYRQMPTAKFWTTNNQNNDSNIWGEMSSFLFLKICFEGTE
jgi:hypothetical protein